MSSLFLRVALPTPLRRTFDYAVPQLFDNNNLIPGIRVQVPFQSRKLVGILCETATETDVPANKLKMALAVLDQRPLITPSIFKLCMWAADYYHYAFGEVIMHGLPTLLRKGHPVPESIEPLFEAHEAPDKQLALNPDQAEAVLKINACSNFGVFLLDGVTGSGKTEVYLQAISHCLAQQKQVLVLVPEISLTPQTIARFRDRLSAPMAVLHSGLSEKQRLQAWLAARAKKAMVIIGTRSAVFTPFADLGLIIIDEEHDQSFKQQDRFRYHARDLAVMRASMDKIPIVLGSATPSLESILNAERGRYHHLSLKQRAGGAVLPQIQLIDLRQEKMDEGLSTKLLTTMGAHLAEQHQILLFLNKRGFAPVLHCSNCHAMMECKRCAARMVYHHTPRRLQCHHCDSRSAIPRHCPQCQQETLQPIGWGTQRLELALAKHFPNVPLIRIDRDNTRQKKSLNTLLEKIAEEPQAILLGTQMLAKGHHFPRVTLVGVIDADSGLFSADFRSTEQMAQLLLQVSGRAGRAEKPGTVLLQTHYPSHPLLQLLIHDGYTAVSQTLLAEREENQLPPYSYLALLRAEAYDGDKAQEFLAQVKNKIPKTVVKVLGPVSANLAKKKGLFCYQLLMQAPERSVLNTLVKKMINEISALPYKTQVKWTLDVDPVEIL